MTLKTRCIPTLLWDQRGLVKPIAFERPGRFVGSLMSAAMLYENRTCDELILLDIDATPNGRGPRFDAIKQFTSKLFCPVTVGGGVRSLADIRELLNAGADKVVIRTHASPGFIRDASTKFGSQCIVVAIDYTTYPGRRFDDTGMVAVQAKQAERAGAGEIILTNMNRDGTRKGYDLETIKLICETVKIPVVANGGCSGPQDMLAAINAGAHAVAASSIFLFDNLTPSDCKAFLNEEGVPVRIET
jgi:imidazole glycerol-phosphate synthase subunit HisF